MFKNDVIHHFGSVGEVAKALGISSQAVSMWPDDVPLVRQYQLERMTKGKLRVSPERPVAKSTTATTATAPPEQA